MSALTRCLMPASRSAQSLRCDDAGDNVEGQYPVDGVAVAIDGKGDAQHEQLALGVLGTGGEIGKLHLLEPVP